MKKIAVCVLVISTFLNIQLVFAEEKQACTCGYDLCGDNLEGQVVGDKDKTKCSCIVETSKLKNCVYKKKPEPIAEAEASKFWGAVSVKEWMSTFTPGGGLESSKAVPTLLSLNSGYGNYFINLSTDLGAKFHSTSQQSGSSIEHGQLSFNLGYFINKEIAVAIGAKILSTSFTNMPAPSATSVRVGADNVFYKTISSIANHQFDDSPFSINGVITYGKGQLSSFPGSTYTGTTSGSTTYVNYEIGTTYSVTKDIKLSAFYRVEQWDDLVPITVNAANSYTLAIQKFKLSGPGVGASYAF